MAQKPFKPGDTFSYVGVVPGLDPSVAWGASCSLREPLQDVHVADLEVTLTQAADFATTHNWTIRLYAKAAATKLWSGPIGNAPKLVGDLRFFDTAHPDPVLHSKTFDVRLAVAVTE